MPRYHIDLHDGTEYVRDREGLDLPDLAAARGHAVRILTRIAQGLTGETGRLDYVVAVRDEAGAVKLRLRMSLDPDPIADPPRDGS